MEAKSTVVGLILVLFLESFLVNAEGLPSIDPTPFAESLALQQSPLDNDMFIRAALIFSDVQADQLETQKARIDGLIDEITEQATAATDIDRAEMVLQILHERVFTVYRERQTRIDVVMNDGSYNCVSSAVLYAAVIKAMGLDVRGIRTVDHAFCQVVLTDQEVDVETTSPHGFNPGEKREFTDHFGKVTGYAYVPPGNYQNRREIDEIGLLALILFNRTAFLSDQRQYEQAVGPAVDAYALLQNEESYERLIVSFLNLASWYGIRSHYGQAVDLITAAMSRFPDEPKLIRLNQDLLHNWVVALIDQRHLDQAQTLLDKYRPALDLQEWEGLAIYIAQLQAKSASRADYEQAVEIIAGALETIGPHTDLLKSYEVYAHNQTAKLINSGDYQLALDYVDQALQTIPKSTLLKRDRSLIESKTR